jgi:hypothetical protein
MTSKMPSAVRAQAGYKVPTGRAGGQAEAD